MGDFDRWRSMVASTPHPELAEIILDESGYTEMWRLDRSPEAPGRLENLKELISAMASFDSLAGFLEHVALVMEGLEDQTSDMVSIMTLHAAKGLEFDLVFLPGWEQGQFPNQRALDAEGQKGLEEERRLAYVGITRARKQLYISYAGRRRIHGQYTDALPSQFLEELPKDQCELVSTASSWGSNWLHQDQGFGNQGFGSAPATGFGSNWGSGRGGNSWSGGGNASARSGTDRGFGYESPGWKRAQERRRQGQVIRGNASDTQPSQTVRATRAFKPGERVFHQKFGYGDVVSVDKDKLVVAFDLSGEKKIIASYVVPASEA
jgi:DNA helicase-2/ATP-dependent DNA helicase PcrA